MLWREYSRDPKLEHYADKMRAILPKIGNSGNAIGMAGAIAPPQKEDSILVGRTLTMETILCLIKSLINTNVKLSMI